MNTIFRLCFLSPAVLGCALATAAAPPLPPALPWAGTNLDLLRAADDPWATPAERSALKETPRYDETIAWLEKLTAATPALTLLSIGRSAEGRDIWMVVAARGGATTPQELAATGRPTLLAQAAIHAGESDGKDAGLMLLRDMTVGETRRALLERANFLFIPILNVDGHERFSAYTRLNQRGPREAGWRTNRRNLNLNRDYAKLETREVRAVVAVLRRWRPDLYLDLHVTDGVDYQYDITWGYNGPHAWSPGIARWLERRLDPALSRDLDRAGHVPGPLIFAVNQRDMSAGITGWSSTPRYSSGYGDAAHIPTVLVENHSLKPYAQRVLGTYVLLDSALRVLADHHEELREAVAADRRAQPKTLALGWRVPLLAEPEALVLAGVRRELYHSAISGATEVRWTGETEDLEVAVLAQTEATHRVARPAYYYIPAAWAHVAERLRLHGIVTERLHRAEEVEVDMYRLPDAAPATASNPYEGRMRIEPGMPSLERHILRLAPGSHRVSTAQTQGDLAMLLLEPQAPDSLFQWGYFLEILSRVEYYEGYVMEPLARRMMREDAALATAFRERVASDAAFAADSAARLAWFYERSPYYDEEYRLYPIGRSVTP